MPDIDGGHYFLTLLAPVKTGESVVEDGRVTTHGNLLREELATLPTAQQSPVCIETGMQSPFARCTRTHFLRLVVIDQPMFNGRDPSDPIMNVLRGVDPLVHQPFDALSRPWLMLAADFDRRPEEPDEGLGSWAEGLWREAEAEMRAIFTHCHGFDGVQDAAGFVAYVKRCQVSTTMSFNDYWPGRPPLKGESFGRLSLGILMVAAGFVALFWALLRPDSLWWLLALVPAGLVAGLLAAIWRLWSLGGKSFPPAPDSDLPSILKALHVQQRFAFFAEVVQGMDDRALHASFGSFLATVRPADAAAPTQPPGVIRSDGVDLVSPEIRPEIRPETIQDRQVML
ncbi:hypothetical protein ACUJ46_10235 [Sandaracinobacteroides sp. A072]|uniref:hypothetical protein n=1 Tax=Sandaracinobacteroides sp. A072 TaxID=3461146 RepID=UPI0040419781